MVRDELFFKAQCYVSNNTPDLYAYKHYDYATKEMYYRLSDAVGQIIFDFDTVKQLVDYIQEHNLPESMSIYDFNRTGELSDYEILVDHVNDRQIRNQSNTIAQ